MTVRRSLSNGVLCAVSLCVTSLSLFAVEGTPAPVWPSGPTGRIARVQTPPTLDKADPLSDPVWQKAESLGPLFSSGKPESADRRTDVRMLLSKDTLYGGTTSSATSGL